MGLFAGLPGVLLGGKAPGIFEPCNLENPNPSCPSSFVPKKWSERWSAGAVLMMALGLDLRGENDAGLAGVIVGGGRSGAGVSDSALMVVVLNDVAALALGFDMAVALKCGVFAARLAALILLVPRTGVLAGVAEAS